MKLINSNVEGMRHLKLIEDFLVRENADVVCLQEANEKHENILKSLGYYTSFLPIQIENRDNEMLPEGIMVGSKQPPKTKSQYYFSPHKELQLGDVKNMRGTYRQGYISAEVMTDSVTYIIVTTHFTWTPNGEIPNQNQIEDTEILLSLLRNEKPHILCGDMNIPRHHNPLYARFLEYYTDSIPKEYKSSLDKTYHRLGNDPEKDVLFNDYMVDYVFTQPPYNARNVRLEFGVSDHAAIVAEIEKIDE